MLDVDLRSWRTVDGNRLTVGDYWGNFVGRDSGDLVLSNAVSRGLAVRFLPVDLRRLAR